MTLNARRGGDGSARVRCTVADELGAALDGGDAAERRWLAAQRMTTACGHNEEDKEKRLSVTAYRGKASSFSLFILKPLFSLEQKRVAAQLRIQNEWDNDWVLS